IPCSRACRRTDGDASGFSSPRRTGGCAAAIAVAVAVGGASLAATMAGPSPASIPISSEPTASICPTSPASLATVPATGDGISTLALSVITNASDWSSATVSPTPTNHSTSSTSAIPSPMSGTLIACRPISGLHRAPHRRAHPPRPREVRPLLRMRIRRVPAGHPLDRRLEVVEAVLLHQRRQFGAEAAGARRLVHHHAAAGLLHRLDDRVEVERPQAAQIDDLGVGAGRGGCRFGGVDPRRVGVPG